MRVWVLLPAALAVALSGVAVTDAWAQRPAPPATQACLKDLQALRGGSPARGAAGDLFGGGGAVRQELRTLYQAARVLAMRGDDEGCRMLVSRMRDIGAQQPPRQPLPQPRSPAAPQHPSPPGQ